MKKEKARMYDFKNPNPKPDFVESLYWFMYGLDGEGLHFDEDEVQEELNDVRALLRVARAAKALVERHSCRRAKELVELEEALKEVEHLLG